MIKKLGTAGRAVRAPKSLWLLVTVLVLGAPVADAAPEFSREIRPLPSTGGTRSEMTVTAERQHWSFLPLHRPPLLSVKDTASAFTPVDHFVHERLEEKNLSLSPLANARKLARGIYSDLTGLPPTPEHVDTFEHC